MIDFSDMALYVAKTRLSVNIGILERTLFPIEDVKEYKT